MLETKNRRVELDIARTFAIICVVLCHATEAIYAFNKNGWANLGYSSRLSMMIFLTVGRLGVPIFLFLSGALVLKKSFEKDEDVLKFYKNNLLKLIIANLIWVVIYNVFFWLNNQQANVTGENVIKEILFLKKVPLANMWYIPMIIGVYIGLPFIAKIVKVFSKKSLSILMILIFICSFILPMINTMFSMLGIKESYSSLISLSFLGGAYGLYVVVGYFLDSKKGQNSKEKNRKNTLILCGVAIVAFIITCAFQIFSYSKMSKVNYNVWYNFPFLIVCAVCIFKLIININTSKINEKLAKLFTFISKTSLGTFFIHIITQSLLKHYILGINVNQPLKVIILFLINFIICMIINFIICKFKRISKYVILAKN